ncbi:MAG: trehalose-6-phosphate synthase [Pseudomonadota bacterium]
MSQLSDTSRLIVVSNRTAVDPESRAGGLAVAVWDSLSKRGGTWIGWSGQLKDYPSSRPRLVEEGQVDFALLDLRKADYDDFYLGYANEVLWPTLHNRLDLAQFDNDAYPAYRRVNAHFASCVMERARDEDFVWVQDYHFFPLARALRNRGRTGRIGFFLHIPFPAPEIFRAIPDAPDLIDAIAHYDLIGLQTAGDVKNLRDTLIEEKEAVLLDAERLRIGDHIIRLRHCPIGIDVDAFRAETGSDAAQQAVARLSRFLDGRKLMLGVDRMDYSKGLPQRFEAIARLFDRYPDTHGCVNFTQIAPPSRSRVDEYKNLRKRIDRLCGRINGSYADLDWLPIRYLARGYKREELAGIYRLAKVCLVTPLQDGMNLVAKEYIAAQDADDPGVLVLSQFAGAAQQMADAIIVNPHDLDGTADAIKQALDMPLSERKRRWQALYDGIRSEDINWWRARYFA